MVRSTLDDLHILKNVSGFFPLAFDVLVESFVVCNIKLLEMIRLTSLNPSLILAIS